MALTVEIDGLDRSTKIDRDNDISFELNINGQGDASFVFADTPDGFVPADGMAVVIKEDGTPRFTGIINRRPRRFLGPDGSGQLTFYSISVATHDITLNKRRVRKAYDQVLFQDIIADWLTDPNILSGEGITLDVTAGTAHTVTFNGERVSEALDILCELEGDGRTWRMNPVTAKELVVETLAETATPVTLDTTTLLGPSDGVEPPTIEPDRSTYANRVTAIGGKPDFVITFMAEDTAEQTARALDEGGTGIYEYEEEVPEARTDATVQAAAEAILEKRKVLRQRFTGTTDTAGFAVGQLGDVALPNLDIALTMYVESVRTWADPSRENFVHTVNMITGDPDGGWMSYYRREKKRPKTIPFQVEAAPGLVRVESEEGVLVHDPIHDPTEYFQAAKSGAQASSPNTIGITHDLKLELTLRRDGATAETIFETWAINGEKETAITPTMSGRWAELGGLTNYKDLLVVAPNSTRAAYIQNGATSQFAVIDIVNGVLMGSVATAISNQGNIGEPLWVGNFVYVPDIATSDIYIYNVTDPTTPTEDNVLSLATLTAVSGLSVSADGNTLIATGPGGIAGIDITDPTAPSQDSTVVGAADYISLDLDNGVLVGMVRATGSQVRVISLSLTGSTVALIAEQLVDLTNSVMKGAAVVHHDGSAIVFSHRISLAGPNTLRAHVFNTSDPTAVTFTETLSYTHGASGHVGPARTTVGRAVLWSFDFGKPQITFGVEQFNRVDPYTIDNPVRVAFGGTGNSGPYQKGDHLIADGLGNLIRVPVGLDNQSLVADEDELTGVKWARELMRGLVNGTFRETFTALVTSDGATVTMTLQQDPTGDLTMFFSDSSSELDCTPALAIALTPGSDTSPTLNFVYVLQSTKALTVSTADWPTADEHIKVGLFLVPSATFVQAFGPYITQNWNDHLNEPSNQGHLPELSHRSRLMSLGAIYHAGIDGNGTTEYVTITTNVGTPDNVHFKSTAGVLLQLHHHAYVAKDTSAGDTLLVPNDSVAAFADISDLADLLLDAAGGSMVGKYFNLVVVGVANKGGEFGPLLVNLPGGSYSKQSDAEQDVSGFDVFTSPGAFSRESSTAFLICRITLRHQNASGGTWTHISTLDLRGISPAAAAGGSTGVTTTEFADNAFRIFDEADVTKVMAWDVSGITTGMTRTLVCPDANGTVAILEAGQILNLGVGDGGDAEIHSTSHANPGTINLGDTLYVDEASNEVGINESNPQSALHVGGDIRINNNAAILQEDSAGSSRVLFRLNTNDILTMGATTAIIRTQIFGGTAVGFSIVVGRFGFGTNSFGSSAVNVISQTTGTAPGSSPGNVYQAYGADWNGAGTVAPHFRTEEGDIIILANQGGLTAEDATVIDATYGAVEEAVLNNVRTRIGELEAAAQAMGWLD